MKMINVLQRLAELDGNNPNVVPAKPQVTPDAAVEAIQKTLSEELSTESLKYLSGIKQTLEECGMYPEGMGMMPPSQPTTPASFSINATAADGDEVANMLSQILTLAGAHKVEPGHMPIDKPANVMSTTPTLGQAGNDEMKKMLDVMNEPPVEKDNPPEDEGAIGTMAGAGLGAALGGPMGAAIGGVAGDSLTGDEEQDEGTGAIPEVDIAGVGGGLAAAAMSDGDEDEIAKGVEAGKEFTDGSENEELEAKDHIRKMMDMLDNTPNRPTNVPPQQVDKFNYQPNNGGTGGDRMDGNMPKGHIAAEDVITQKLFSDYQQFVTEAEKTKTMSRAAKGWKKYGDGMPVLAQMGKDGASEAEMDKARDKFNKYK